MKKILSYEKGTNGLGYEVTKLRDSNATYRDNLLWRIVMHYMEIKWREFPMVIGRERRREHPQPTFCSTTKTKRGKKPGISRTYCRTEPLPVTSVWRHFRSNLYHYSSNKKDADMRRTCFRSGPLPNRDSSGHVTWSLPVKKVPLVRILCNFRLRMRRTYLRTGQVNDVISGHMTYVTSGHVTFGSTSHNLRKCGLSCTHILLAWWFYSLLVLLTMTL